MILKLLCRFGGVRVLLKPCQLCDFPKLGSSASSYAASRPRRHMRSRHEYPFEEKFKHFLTKVPPSDSPNLVFEERLRAGTMGEQARPKLAFQTFDYFLVLDFEATCDKIRIPVPQEIIEFPVMKIDARTMVPVATFHHFVQPRINRELTPFCTQLTGIIQDMVDGQPHLEDVLHNFDKWLLQQGLLDPKVSFCFVTCGDWDLGLMLKTQAAHFKISLPAYFRTWINVKHSFSEAIGHYPRSLKLMLASLSLEQNGREHSGIDDCKNILQIMRALAEKGYTFRSKPLPEKSAASKTNLSFKSARC